MIGRGKRDDDGEVWGDGEGEEYRMRKGEERKEGGVRGRGRRGEEEIRGRKE